jgi:integrase
LLREAKDHSESMVGTATAEADSLLNHSRAEADRLLGHARQLESLTRQNALTPETAVSFQHWKLLTEADLARWFPGRRGPLSWDAETLLGHYLDACHERMTSPSAIHRNGFRAEKLLDRLGNLSQLSVEDVRTWRQERLREVARKTVNLEHDVLRQLLDECQRLGWRPDNPARRLEKLPWKLSRLPKALTYAQVQTVLQQAQELGAQQPPHSLKGGLYRLVVAGVYFGLRRGELQYLVWGDTQGRQVYVQGKTLPDGQPWVPKDREARVIQYAGIERPIGVVFGETPQAGYVFSPAADRSRPYHADSLTTAVEAVLKPLSPELSLHSLRHTFATWRLEMGDAMARVQRLMGHGDANTLMRYAHIEPDPLVDLLPLLG